MTIPELRVHLRTVAGVARRRPKLEPEPPVPPPLPPGRTVLLPGRGELFLREADGPADEVPVLLLHGWTWTADLNWWPVYEPLARNRRVLAVDHRDHGRSMRIEAPFRFEDAVEDLVALLDVLGIPEVIVCGYSMGGSIALLLAERLPDRVVGLVMAASTLDFSSGSWLASARWRLMPLFGGVIRLGHFHRIVTRYLRWAAEQAPEFVPYRAWAAGEWRLQMAKDIVDGGEAMAAFDMRERAIALRRLPSVVVLPVHDQLVEPWRQRAMAEALDAEVVEMDGNHFVNLEAPKHLADAVVEAVEKVAAAVRLSG